MKEHVTGLAGIDEGASRMVCSISAGMLGICLTCISLMRLVITIRHENTLADDLLCVNALMFLTTMILSYLSIRTISSRRLHRVERFADGLFLASMCLLTINCFFVTYAISSR